MNKYEDHIFLNCCDDMTFDSCCVFFQTVIFAILLVFITLPEILSSQKHSFGYVQFISQVLNTFI